jgi:hypothetical protein
MGGVVAALIGIPIAVFGFLVMRDPMRLSILAPGDRGYYQRALFDRSSRNSTRGFGVLLCLFGLSIATDGLASVFRTMYLEAISRGIWILMSLVFVALFCSGIVISISRLVRGKSLGWSDWFLMRRRGIELGPIDVFPQVTPQMQRETRLFTVGLAVLVCVAAAAALAR